VSAAVIALAAVGFTVQFGISNIFNFAYGAIMITATYVGSVLNSHGSGLAVCCLAGAAVGAVMSVLMNRLVFVPFVRRGVSAVGMFIVCLQLAVVIESVIQIVAGEGFFAYNVPPQAPVSALTSIKLLLTPEELTVIGLAVAVIVTFTLFLKVTQLGQAMRATSSNARLAKSCGIRTSRIIDIAWLMSGALCGLAGVIFGYTVGAFAANSGTDFLIVALAAILLGAGKPLRAALGSIIVGVSMEVLALYIPADLKELAAFAILLAIMLIRPEGIARGGASLFREMAT
jgi:branched-chain amino acid transport system permease protein/neutral amino acid transport system permease protein